MFSSAFQSIPLQAVEIEINHACNRECTYCPNSIAERKTKGFMSTEIYQKILDNLSLINFQGRVSYDFYNEPLLHPQISKFIALTKKQLPGSKLHIYTNGTLLTEKKLLELLESGVDLFVVTRHEQDENSDTYKFAGLLPTLSFGIQQKISYRSYKDLTLVNRGGILKHIASDGLNFAPCHIPSHMLTVTVDGRVLSCFEDFHETLIFGDLKTENIIDIWEKKSYTNFRNDLRRGLRHLHSPCNKCNRKQALPPFDV